MTEEDDALQQKQAAESDMAAQALIAQYLPQQALDALRHTIHASEQRHTGQIVLCIEASLSPEDMLKHASPRQRALALFGELRVWDTEDNNGAMLYLLMSRHAIELVADRALNRCVAQAAWDSITQRLAVALRAHQYENGLQSALEQMSGLLIAHFPSSAARPRDNTVSDAPVVLP
jgi:uncharacterized membrane protein